jgi:hypothetical protein
MDPAPAPYMIRMNGHLGATVLSAFPALAPQHDGALGLDLPARSGDPLLLVKAAISRGQDHQDLSCPRSARANHRDPVTLPNLPGGKPDGGPPPGREFSAED